MISLVCNVEIRGRETTEHMASGKIRSTRRLRSWMVEQVNSGKYPGLIWDNTEKTMFRIPWKHAGKQDYRSDEDAAIFKAWAEFKGKLSDTTNSDPASWKTRLRCALNKSTEFSEVTERSQMDISEPYKVYLLNPVEQGAATGKQKKMLKRSFRTSSDSEQDEQSPSKKIKEEVDAAQLISNMNTEQTLLGESRVLRSDSNTEDIQLNFTIEEVPSAPLEELPCFHITVHYIGQEVLRRDIMGSDVRIAYLPLSPVPPSSPPLKGNGFERIPLPDPTAQMGSEVCKGLSDLLPHMERGVVLSSSQRGVYAMRFCRGRVFCRGPHEHATCKMERGDEPTLLFSTDKFRNELESFRTRGERPMSEIIMCFGEELSGEDLSEKLIIVKISLPRVEAQIQQVNGLQEVWRSLAVPSSTGEITLNLVQVLEQTAHVQ